MKTIHELKRDMCTMCAVMISVADGHGKDSHGRNLTGIDAAFVALPDKAESFARDMRAWLRAIRDGKRQW